MSIHGEMMVERGEDMTDGDRAIRKPEVVQLFAPAEDEETIFRSSVFVCTRTRISPSCDVVSQRLPEDGLEIRFFRWSPNAASASLDLEFPAQTFEFKCDDTMGELLTQRGRQGSLVCWLPRSVSVGVMDPHGRLKVFDQPSLRRRWAPQGPPRLHLELEEARECTVYWPLVLFEDGAAEEAWSLFAPGEIERRRFLKSDWFDASSPADLWDYFIDGSVFDPRGELRGRFRCQQCAYAWWSFLEALYRKTGKKPYRALARAVAWSVRSELVSGGAWHHGFWNQEPEVHARMLWDGVRLLLSEHEIAPHGDLVAAAEQVVSFAVANLTERLAGGDLWFLHDSAEGSRPLRIKSSVLGRSERNSLCLNTHVQALCVLSLMQRLPKSRGFRFVAELERGLHSLDAILSLRCRLGPSLLFRRLLRRLIECKVPHGLMERGLRFVVFRLLGPVYWWVRGRCRGLVFPSGYLDRDLGLTMLADEYHIVNLKDLVELHRERPRPQLRQVITEAASFAASLDFARALERSPIWAEWADVLITWEAVDGADLNRVLAEIESALGGSPLDTLTASCGLWCGGGER